MKELYNAVLRAMQNQVPSDHRFCSNCIAHLVKEERMRRQVELNRANQERAYERTQKGVQGFVK